MTVLRRRLPVLLFAPVPVLATAGVLMMTGAAAAAPPSTVLPTTQVAEPSSFTSTYSVRAAPDQVVNADGEAVGGEPGSSGRFDLRVNSALEVLCYDIVLQDFSPPYESPARTSTHIHEGPAGVSGPPRIVFPDPIGQADGSLRTSGCLQVPMETGVAPDGQDAGAGFSLSALEAAPAGFYVDVHSAQFVPGAMRGQLAAGLPAGGADTGGGGTAESGLPAAAVAVSAVAVAGLAGAVGVLALRRRPGALDVR